MGAIRFSIDPALVQALREALPIEVFVETGTFNGQTIDTVLPFFDEIYTCEASKDLHREAVKKFSGANKVRSLLGDSGRILKDLSPRLRDRSVLFWLDAHWCMDEETAGVHSQCPLLQELDAIEELNASSVIAIDDARLFLCAPPIPYEVEQWPSFDAVLRKLYSLSREHEIMVVNDTLIFHPAQIRRHLKDYAHGHSIDWLSVLDKWREYDQILKQSQEKESEIMELKRSAEERMSVITWLHNDIDRLKSSYYYRLGYRLLAPFVTIRNRLFPS